MDLRSRLTDISGPTTVDPPYTEFITLDFRLKTVPLGTNLAVRDVMDVRASPMCYVYV